MNKARHTFSVVIPLYNKGGYIVRALRSVAAQSFPPLEILVVDDGSTDGGAERAEQEDIAGLRVIRQENSGVSAARNRGISEAKGEFVAFLDADDWWETGFLECIKGMIERYPGCGIYCTGFRIHRRSGIFDNEKAIKTEGVVENYFRTAFSVTLCWTSALAIPRTVLLASGGFPAGMHRGQDLYTWTKIALTHKVCYSPERMSNYDVRVEANSKRRYKPDIKEHSFLDFMEPGNDDLNEYLARYQIGLAILQSVNGYTAAARRTEEATSFTRRYRIGWNKLYALDRMPIFMRKAALGLYQRLAWLISEKGKME